MRNCPLCDLELDDTDLTRFYLGNKELIRFVQKRHPRWKPEQGGCSRCLDAFFRQWSAISPDTPSEEKTIVTVPDGFAPEEIPAQGGTCFITIHGADLGKKYDLLEGETILGRSETAGIRINEENVSRNHAKIIRRSTDVTIEDLNSTNGTFVNTRKITTHSLKDGDLVLAGNTILKFVSGSNVEHQYHEEIYRLATMDGLTQLYNRSFFLDKLADEFSRSRRYDRDLSLILFDFDHFKLLNDTYGHPAGDEVLRTAASLVSRNMRKEDVCGRYGGEEVGILLPEASHTVAMRLAEKIRQLIERTDFRYNQQSLHVTISVGVASLAKEIRTVRLFIERADQALYRAKAEGRNCIRS